MKRWARTAGVLAALAALLGTLQGVSAAAPSTLSISAAPLAAPVWLCRPGQPGNACGQAADGRPTRSAGIRGRYADGHTVPLDATPVDAAAGTAGRAEPLTVAAAPPVDCFYVYPTIDTLPNPLPQLGPTPPEPRDEDTAVTLAQVGRFAPQCRLFVPLYRQQATAALLTGLNTALGTSDIEQAWDQYWARDNLDPATGERRGVVLIGHSQGTFVSISLVKDRFEGHPDVLKQLVSALLIGGNVQVPLGGSVGGPQDTAATFHELPACVRSDPGQPVPTGCVVAYSTYNQEPGTSPDNGAFGKSTAPDHQILCVNPAALLDGVAPATNRTADGYFPDQTLVRGNPINPGGAIALTLLGFTPADRPTGFTHYPGPGTVGCRFTGDATSNTTWLNIEGADAYVPTLARAIPFGTHVGDLSIVSGDLARLITAQTRAWAVRTAA